MSAMEFTDHRPNSVLKATSKISSRGQIVIPIEIRKTLGLTEGDDLTFIVNDDGEIKVEVVKKQRLSELIGILKTNKPFRPVEKIRKEVYRNKAEKELKDGEEE